MGEPDNIEGLRMELQLLERRLKDLEQQEVKALDNFDSDATHFTEELTTFPVLTYLAVFHQEVFSSMHILTGQFMGISKSNVEFASEQFIDKYLHSEDRNCFNITYYALKHPVNKHGSRMHHHHSLFRLSSTSNGWIWVHATNVLRRIPGDPARSEVFGLGVDISALIRRNDEAIRLANENRRLKARIFDSLGRRERKMVYLLLEGKSSHEIANIFHLSKIAAEAHLEQLLSKLEINEIEDLLQYISHDAE